MMSGNRNSANGFVLRISFFVTAALLAVACNFPTTIVLEDFHERFEITELQGPNNAIRLWQEYSLEGISYVQIEEKDGVVSGTLNEITNQLLDSPKSREGRFLVNRCPLELDGDSRTELRRIYENIQRTGKRGFPSELYIPIPVPDDGWTMVEARTNGYNWTTGYRLSSNSKSAKRLRKVLRKTYKAIGVSSNYFMYDL